MSITPEKNGCNVWLEEYGCWLHGDSYHLPRSLLAIRTCPEKIYSTPPFVHYRIDGIAHWFDEHERYGVLIVAPHLWTYYGYEGKPT